MPISCIRLASRNLETPALNLSQHRGFLIELFTMKQGFCAVFKSRKSRLSVFKARFSWSVFGVVASNYVYFDVLNGNLKYRRFLLIELANWTFKIKNDLILFKFI